MSYKLDDEDTVLAYEMLHTPRDDSFFGMMGDVPELRVRHEALRNLLIALCCPIVCVGYVNESGWHRLCEQKADDALAALSLYQTDEG